MYKTIVVAIKNQDESSFMIDKLKNFVDKNSHIILCNVVNIKLVYSTTYHKNKIDYLKIEAENWLDNLKNQMVSDGYNNVSTFITIGNVKRVLAYEIVSLFNPELIVCAESKVRRNSRGIIMGVANYLNINTKSDILLVREEDGLKNI